MGLAKKVKMLLILREMTMTQLAEKLDTSPQNLGNKLSRDNLSEKDLLEIAEALNCDFEATFTLRDTGKTI